jgi:hypothetical protein
MTAPLWHHKRRRSDGGTPVAHAVLFPTTRAFVAEAHHGNQG